VQAHSLDELVALTAQVARFLKASTRRRAPVPWTTVRCWRAGRSAAREQSAIVDALVTVTVLPTGQGAREFDPRSVDILWRRGREHGDST
jgi:hypothetical protein